MAFPKITNYSQINYNVKKKRIHSITDTVSRFEESLLFTCIIYYEYTCNAYGLIS